MAAVIYFHKPDCEPCQERKAVIYRLVEAGVKVYFQNVAEPQGRAQAELYRVKSVPTAVIIDAEGRRVAGFFGKLIRSDTLLRFLGK